jgi:hypothetical protein
MESGTPITAASSLVDARRELNELSVFRSESRKQRCERLKVIDVRDRLA